MSPEPALGPPDTSPPHSQELFEGEFPTAIRVNIDVSRGLEVALIGHRYVRGRFGGFHVLKSLSRIELGRIQRMAGHHAINSVPFELTPFVMGQGVGYTHVSGSGAIHLVQPLFVLVLLRGAPESLTRRERHGLGDTMLDVLGEDIWPNLHVFFVCLSIEGQSQRMWAIVEAF